MLTGQILRTEEMHSATHLKEYAKGREEDSEDQLENVRTTIWC
jgi:hypothetical protein